MSEVVILNLCLLRLLSVLYVILFIFLALKNELCVLIYRYSRE